MTAIIALCIGIAYLLIGLGVIKFIAKRTGRPMVLMVVLIWPIVLLTDLEIQP